MLERRRRNRSEINHHSLSVCCLVTLVITIHQSAVASSFVTSLSSTRHRQYQSRNFYLHSTDPSDQEGQARLGAVAIDEIVDTLDILDDDVTSVLERKPQSDDPFQATGTEDLIRTLAGGPALIFEMARKSILFVQESTMADTSNGANIGMPDRQHPRKVLPRWHPYPGISDANPSFRTQSPAMNNQGFAKSIWRNVRKRNKPSLWRNALRTYDRMAILEEDPVNYIRIQRSNIHHEGAMLACAKLGLWQRALEIYHYVYQQEQEGQALFNQQEQEVRTTISERTKSAGNKRKRVYVTDNMILSLVRACVRASRLRSRRKRGVLDGAPPPSPEQEEREAALRRIPLDTALEVLSTLQAEHNIPLVAYFVNPLASAYQSLGYLHEGREILQTMLSNRTAGEEPEDGVDIFNVNDLCAKDKGSYSLLVQGAVVAGDWGSAIEALADMTNAGLYPNPRHCNVWSEISERQTRPRAVGSWKKKRDDYWTDSVR